MAEVTAERWEELHGLARGAVYSSSQAHASDADDLASEMTLLLARDEGRRGPQRWSRHRLADRLVDALRTLRGDARTEAGRARLAEAAAAGQLRTGRSAYSTSRVAGGAHSRGDGLADHSMRPDRILEAAETARRLDQGRISEAERLADPEALPDGAPGFFGLARARYRTTRRTGGPCGGGGTDAAETYRSAPREACRTALQRFIRWGLVLAPLVALALPAAAQGRREMLANGGFEAGTAGWSYNGTVAPSTFAQLGDATEPHEGERFAAFHPVNVHNSALEQRFGVDPGEPVTCSAWLRRTEPGSTGGLNVEEYDAAGALVLGHYNHPPLGGSGVWQRLAFEVTPGPETRELLVRGWSQGHLALDGFSCTVAEAQTEPPDEPPAEPEPPPDPVVEPIPGEDEDDPGPSNPDEWRTCTTCPLQFGWWLYCGLPVHPSAVEIREVRPRGGPMSGGTLEPVGDWYEVPVERSDWSTVRVWRSLKHADGTMTEGLRPGWWDLRCRWDLADYPWVANDPRAVELPERVYGPSERFTIPLPCRLLSGDTRCDLSIIRDIQFGFGAATGLTFGPEETGADVTTER